MFLVHYFFSPKVVGGEHRLRQCGPGRRVEVRGHGAFSRRRVLRSRGIDRESWACKRCWVCVCASQEEFTANVGDCMIALPLLESASASRINETFGIQSHRLC